MLVWFIALFVIFLIVIIAGIVNGIRQSSAQIRAKEEYDRYLIRQQIEQEEKLRQEERNRLAEARRFRDSFPIVSQTKEIQELWSNPCDHDSIDQIKRQKRINETRPIQINRDTLDGIFVSSRNDLIYKTNLIDCDCPDYMERMIPCKHMYRLFYDLEHIDTVNTHILNIDPSVRIAFREFPQKTQIQFVNIARFLNNALLYNVNTDIKRLIKSGFLISHKENLDYAPLLFEMTKDAILLSLVKRGISGFYASWSKVRLIDWILQNQHDYLEAQFKSYTRLEIGEIVTDWVHGIKDAYRRSLYSYSNYLR